MYRITDDFRYQTCKGGLDQEALRDVVDRIKIRLIDVYNVCILHDMLGMATLNVIDGKRIPFTCQTMQIDINNMQDTLDKITMTNWDETKVDPVLVDLNGNFQNSPPGAKFSAKIEIARRADLCKMRADETTCKIVLPPPAPVGCTYEEYMDHVWSNMMEPHQVIECGPGFGCTVKPRRRASRHLREYF